MTIGTKNTPYLEAVPVRPFVVARRWDQLGSRLCAIVNARSLAELLDLEFRFAWPRAADAHMNNPGQIFSEAFLDRFEIHSSELENRPAVPWWQLISLPVPESHRALTDAGATAFLDANEPFAVVRSPNESLAVARERYRRLFDETGWSEEARRLMDFSRRWPADGPIAAVHVRAGDIVGGAWRHVVGHEKYSPTPFVHHAIERLTERGEKPALVLSDNAQYLAWLRGRFPTLITSAEIVPEYAGLTELQQALADILLLARCEPIIGPPNSAFSRLAANLGPGEHVRADAMAPPGRERRVLRAGIAAHGKNRAGSQFWPPLLARDICWYLDVFGDTTPLGEQRRLVRRAVKLDAEFLAAQARLARVEALAGDWRAARGAAARALAIAHTAEHHHDPLLEALATDIGCKCIAAVQGRPPRSADTDAAAFIAELNRGFSRCLELYPVWFSRDDVFDGLKSLIAIAERLVGETPDVRRQAARSFAEANYDDLDLPGVRSSGLLEHRASGTYDPLTRDLDRMGLHLYEAVDGADLGIEPPRLAR